MKRASPNFGELLKDDPQAPEEKRAPRAGELFYNPNLACTFKLLGEEGKKGFYEGRVAEAIVKAVRDRGGCLSLEDLREHGKMGSEFTEPLRKRFKGQRVGKLDDGARPENERPPRDEKSVDREKPPRDEGDSHDEKRSRIESSIPPADGVDVWEHAPNGQGLVALLALGILEELERSKRIPAFTPQDHNSVDYLHALIECIKLGFADAHWHVADPAHAPAPLSTLLSPEYLASRAALFDPSRAAPDPRPGPLEGFMSSDTVYLAVTDRHGNAASFINSNFDDFGSGIVPRGCGFPLQNRGSGFALGPDDHPNIYAPGKRPYHTIIPAMLTNPSDGSLHTVLGVMGGFMQPQGHVQVLLNMLSCGMSPQAALDAPRFCVGPGMAYVGGKGGTVVHLEEGIPEEVVDGLRDGEGHGKGHTVEVVKGSARRMFGRGQVIRCHEEDGKKVYSAGSDMRGDGAAFPA